MTKRLLGLGFAALAALVTATCKSAPTAPPEPVAGDLTISLVTPNSDDGAVVVRVTASQGNQVTAVTVLCANCRIFKEQPSATELRAVVTGDVVAGPLVRVSVTDKNASSAYAVQVQQVASRTYQVRATSGYSLTIQ